MKTKKDLVFLICVITWLSSGVIAYIFDNDGTITALHSIVCVFLVSILVALKNHNKRFGDWLDLPISGIQFTTKELDAIYIDIFHILEHVSLSDEHKAVRLSIIDKLNQCKINQK